MKKIVSVLLAIVMTFSVTPITATEVYGDVIYTRSYGEQIAGEYQGLSQEVYEELVSHYVYENGDKGNTNNKYTGLAKPLSEEGSAVIVKDRVPFSFTANNSETIQKATNNALAAFRQDYPEVYWLEGFSYLISGSYDEKKKDFLNLELTIKPKTYKQGTEDNVKTFNDAVLNVKSDIEKSVGVKASAAKKVKAIHDYIGNNVDYNYDAANELMTKPESTRYSYAFTPFPVFVKQNGENNVVCEGYAKATKILCDLFNIPCALITGWGVNQYGDGESHMWNAVSIANKWYGLDVTWDDQTANINEVMTMYFLVGKNSIGIDGKKTFAEDHIVENVFTVGGKRFVAPEIEKEGYKGNLEEEITTTNKPTETTKKPEIPTSTKPTETTKEPEVTTTVKPVETTKKQEITTTVKPVETTKKPETTTTAKPMETTRKPEIPTSRKPTVHKYVWKISGIKDQTYNGKQITQKIKIVCEGVTLIEGKDYKVSYKNNTKAGKASLIINPIGKFKGTNSVSTSFTIKKASISKASVGKIKKQKYKKGKAIKPRVTVKFAGKKLKNGRDYKLTYRNNKKKGTAKIVITGKGNFAGKKTVKFKIK